MSPSQVSPTGLAAYEMNWQDVRTIPDDDLVSFIELHYLDGKLRRSNWERMALEQLAFAEGDQGVVWNADDSELDAVDTAVRDGVPIHEVNPIYINTIKGVVFQKIALVLGGPINLFGVPRSGDDEDVNAARVATKTLRYVLDRSDQPIRFKIYQALWTMFCTGPVFPHVHWDAYMGIPEQFDAPKMDDSWDDAKRKEMIKAYKTKIADGLGRREEDIFDDKNALNLPPGDVNWTFATGFDITEPEFTSNISEASWIIHTSFRSMEHLQARYDAELVDKINPNLQDDQYINMYRTTYGVTAATGDGGMPTAMSRPELVVVHVFWRPRRPWCPMGAHVIMANKVLLHKGPNPYFHGQLPFSTISEIPSRKFRTTGSTVRQLMTLQKGRNRMRSAANYIIDKIVAPKLMIEGDMDIPVNAFDGQDRKIHVPHGALSQNKIKFMEPPTLPTDLYRLDAMYQRDMQDVANVHDSTTGRGENKQQSGRHAAIMLENDTRANHVTREYIKQGLADAGMQTLALYWQFVKSERHLHVTGHDFDSDLRDFRGDQLFDQKRLNRLPGPQDFNVDVELGRDDQKAQMFATIELMTQLGYWTPQTHGQTVERMVSQGLATEHDEYGWHRRNAGDEHRDLLARKEVRTNLGDLDEIHTEEHYRWTTTGEYRMAVKTDKDLADKIDVHIREHMYNAAEKRQRLEQIEVLAKELVRQELERDADPETKEVGTIDQAAAAGPTLVPDGATFPALAGVIQA